MRAVKRINNNVAACIDDAGNEVLAIGKGIGFGTLPREVPLSEIDRTFYDVPSRYQEMLGTVTPEIMEIALQIVKVAQNKLPYQIAKNAVFTIADHIQFAVERMDEGLHVYMPLAYDVEQNYPNEYRIGVYAIRLIKERAGIALPSAEAVGIALNLVNARTKEIDDNRAQIRIDKEAANNQKLLDCFTGIIEEEYSTIINRSSFAYSRYATHVLYLLKHLAAGETTEDGISAGFTEFLDAHPHESICAKRIDDVINATYGKHLSSDGLFYLVLHIARLCSKEGIDERNADEQPS